MSKVKVSNPQAFPAPGEEAQRSSRIVRYSRIRLGRYYADFCRDSQVAPETYHFVIQRDGSTEIVSWDQRPTLKDALEAAQRELEYLVEADGSRVNRSAAAG